MYQDLDSNVVSLQLLNDLLILLNLDLRLQQAKKNYIWRVRIIV